LDGAIASGKSYSSVMFKLAYWARACVIGEIQCVLDQAVEIDTPTLAAATRVCSCMLWAKFVLGKICAKPLIFYRASRP